MKLQKMLQHSFVLLLLLATLVSVLPLAFATESETAVQTAEGDAGIVTYAAGDPVQNVTTEHSQERVHGFWLNPDNFTINQTNVQMLYNLGSVTDVYVLVKGTNGGTISADSLTALKNVISYAGTNMRVHAWVMVARDDTYIANNPTSAYYHFRAGYKNGNALTKKADNGYYDSNSNAVNGFVDLRNTAYQTYFQTNVVDVLAGVSGLDGIHLDTIRYGAMTYDWGSNLKAYMGKEDYNTVAMALCVSNGYTYTKDSNGYIIYKANGSTPTGSKLEDLFAAGNTAAKRLETYRIATVTNFVSSVKKRLDSQYGSLNLILSAAVMPEAVQDEYQTMQYGQSCVKLGPLVDYVIPMTYTHDYYANNGNKIDNAWPATVAKLAAQQGANVVAGLQGYAAENEHAYKGQYPTGADLRAQMQYLYTARRSINGDPTVAGDILGAAVFRLGTGGSAYVSTRFNPNNNTLTVNLVNGSPTSLSSFKVELRNGMKYNAAGESAITSNFLKYSSMASSDTAQLLTFNVSIAAYGTVNFIIPVTGTVNYNRVDYCTVGVYKSDGSQISVFPEEWANSNHIKSCAKHYKIDSTKSRAATCSAAGYNVYVCEVCGDSYSEYVKPNGMHVFNSSGVCTICGHDHGDLIHFKAGSEETTWDWQLANAANTAVSYDTTENGSMLGTSSANGKIQNFLVWQNGNCSYEHTICAGDVVQVRYRYKVKSNSSGLTTVKPDFRFHTEADTNFQGYSGNATQTVSLSSTGWQTVTIPIPGSVYKTGTTIDRILFSPFGSATNIAAELEVDYIYIGQQATAPVTVTFVDDTNKVLEVHPISYNTTTYFFAGEPTKASTDTVRYIFRGWRDSTGKYVDPSKTKFTKNTTLTANFTTIYAAPLGSAKTISDPTPGDETYQITLDAYTYGKNLTLDTKQPLNISIVLDRSGSMSFPADTSKDKSFADYTEAAGLTALNNYLNTLDKTKPMGYYTATNWLNVQYYSATEYGYGYVSFEPLRYNNTTKTWQVWMTKSVDELTAYAASTESTTDYWYDYCAPFGILGTQVSSKGFGGFNTISGSWVNVTDAYIEFASRKAYFTNEVLSKNASADMSKLLFKISTPRRTVLMNALNDFIDKIYATTDDMPAGTYHSISVVSYGYGVYADGEAIGALNGAKYSNSTAPRVSTAGVILDSQSDVNAVKNIITSYYSYGTTRTDLGLKKGQSYLQAQKTANPKGKSVMILVTDGSPTSGTGFEDSVANAALTVANAMEAGEGVQVFALGYMAGLNHKTDYVKSATTEAQKANNFMHLVSSNYPNATNMNTPGARDTAKGNHYFSTANGAELATYMENIFTATDTVETATINGSILLYDVVKREWVPSAKQSNGYYFTYTVQSYDYAGLGEFSTTAKTLDTSKYTIEEKVLSNGDVAIYFRWTDAPNAYLRETATNGTRGYKIVVKFNITVNRDRTLGGNNIPTNGADSGAYYPDNQTTATIKTIYDVPNVNVKPVYDIVIHDYFMELTDTKNSSGAVTKAGLMTTIDNNGSINPFVGMYTRKYKLDGLNNKYLKIAHIVDDAKGIRRWSETLPAGKTTNDWGAGRGTHDVSASGTATSFDYTRDMTGFKTGYVITPTTQRNDTLGNAPYKASTVTKTTNYYAPKFAVIDYGSKISIDLSGEASLTPQVRENCTIASGLLTYQPGSILTNLTTAKYKVTAINTPKGQSTKTVNRTAHIFPADVVNYETDVLSQSEGWTGLGTFQSNWKQKYDNTVVHGYDAEIRKNGATLNYSYGHTCEASVGRDTTEEPVMTFSFMGTGFDVISQNSPNDGVMVVEVYSDAAMTKAVKRFLVDNYLADQTLYQVPVVHCTDLEYGTYYVKIRAYYHDIFNHKLQATRSILTEARIRSVLGLSESDVLDISLSPSGFSTTRGVTRATEAAGYLVHVDGVRIYQTLNATPSDKASVYAYSFAKENGSAFLNARALLLDSDNWSSSGTDGMVYIAAGGTNVSADTKTDGIHLSMSGIINHETVNGVNYLLNGENQRVMHPEYGTALCYRISNGVCIYYCLNKKGTEVSLTAAQVGEIMGRDNVVYYGSTYEVSGPKNEIYLTENRGVAFNVGADFNLSNARIQLSFRSLNGQNAYPRIYSETQRKFVDLCSSSNYVNNRSEMYFDVTDYVTADGDIIIMCASGSSDMGGVLSLCNVKLIGAVKISTPAKTVARALQLLNAEAADAPVVCGHESVSAVDNGDGTHKLVCGLCNAVISSAEDHSFADGICTACGAVENMTPATSEDLVFAAKALSLQSYTAFDVLCHYDVLNNYDSYYVVFERSDASNGTTDTRTVTGVTSAASEKYHVFEYPVYSYMMADEITATLYGVKDGVTYIGESYTSSVRAYALSKLPETDEAMKAVYANLLNYGARAQELLNYKTDDLATAGLGEYESYITSGAPTAESTAAVTTDGCTAIELKTRALGLNAAVELQFVLEKTDVYTQEQLYAVYTFERDGETVTGRVEGEDFAQSAGYWVVKVDALTAMEGKTPVSVTVYSKADDGRLSETWTYSIESHVALKLPAEPSTAQHKVLLAMMHYYNSVSAAY